MEQIFSYSITQVFSKQTSSKAASEPTNCKTCPSRELEANKKSFLIERLHTEAVL